MGHYYEIARTRVIENVQSVPDSGPGVGLEKRAIVYVMMCVA